VGRGLGQTSQAAAVETRQQRRQAASTSASDPRLDDEVLRRARELSRGSAAFLRAHQTLKVLPASVRGSADMTVLAAYGQRLTELHRLISSPRPLIDKAESAADWLTAHREDVRAASEELRRMFLAARQLPGGPRLPENRALAKQISAARAGIDQALPDAAQAAELMNSAAPRRLMIAQNQRAEQAAIAARRQQMRRTIEDLDDWVRSHGATDFTGADLQALEFDTPQAQGSLTPREVLHPEQRAAHGLRTLADELADDDQHVARELLGLGYPSEYTPSAEVRQRLTEGASVPVYRAVPADSDQILIPGGYVTLSEQYAHDHGAGPMNGNYRIHKVNATAAELLHRGDAHELLWAPADADRALEQMREQIT
jgi:hypothetical protein